MAKDNRPTIDDVLALISNELPRVGLSVPEIEEMLRGLEDEEIPRPKPVERRFRTTEELEKAYPQHSKKAHCRRCGKATVFREGKFGLFYGCSGYPECRATYDADPITGVIRLDYRAIRTSNARVPREETPKKAPRVKTRFELMKEDD